MNALRFTSRILTGLLFIFSGTVKAIDPLGSAYKFTDYFQAFHLHFLQNLALPLAIMLCTAEFLAGLSVLTGYRQKEGIWLVMILMFIFTPLTFILAILNPVSDCGCFGDAIHLTNWQTFGKNIIILFFALVVFMGRKRFEPVRTPKMEWTGISLAGILFAGFSLMNLRYLPLIDFLPYKKGASIPAEMKIPVGKPVDQYKTTFIYEKDGRKKEFTLENYPANDSTWVFVDQKSVLVKKGYRPPIHDFSFATLAGEDLTGQILADRGYNLLMISKKLGEARPEKIREGFSLGKYCLSEGMGFHIITASGSDEIRNFGNADQFCLADETTLKTMVRSNPGYMLLKGGIIMGKWSGAGLPAFSFFKKENLDSRTGRLNHRRYPLYIATGLLSLAIILLVTDTFLSRNKMKA